MKKDIHPKYFESATVRCACGNTFTVGSTKEYIEVEVCPKCHPFFTGKEKVLETVGQVQKYKARMSQKKEVVKSKKTKRAEAKAKKTSN